MYELIGCPMHLGVSDKGLKQSIDALNNRYKNLNIKKIDEVILPEQNLSNLKNLNSVVATCENIATEIDAVINRGNLPIFIGGDHAAAIGSISGVANNYNNLGLIWIDSHSDINTSKTTVTGNIHGMPVSALMDLGETRLTNIMGSKQKILPQNVVLFGVRDVDPPEQKIIKQLNIKTYSYNEIIKRGLKTCLNEAKEYLSSIQKLHISFDLDSMDPEIIKGVSVPVASGFNQQDVSIMFEFLLKEFEVSSIDIVEYNPIYDTDLYTAEFTNSLLQKIMAANKATL